MSGDGCGVIVKVCETWPGLPTVLPGVVVDVEGLLEYLDYSFSECIYLWVVGGREGYVHIACLV